MRLARRRARVAPHRVAARREASPLQSPAGDDAAQPQARRSSARRDRLHRARLPRHLRLPVATGGAVRSPAAQGRSVARRRCCPAPKPAPRPTYPRALLQHRRARGAGPARTPRGGGAGHPPTAARRRRAAGGASADVGRRASTIRWPSRLGSPAWRSVSGRSFGVLGGEFGNAYPLREVGTARLSRWCRCPASGEPRSLLRGRLEVDGTELDVPRRRRTWRLGKLQPAHPRVRSGPVPGRSTRAAPGDGASYSVATSTPLRASDVDRGSAGGATGTPV